NAPHIALSPIHDVKTKPHQSLVAIVAAVEIAAIQTESREVSRVEVLQIAQRMNAVNFFGTAFPKLEMKVGILRVFLTDGTDDVALLHLCAWNHTFGDAVEMEIDKEQVIFAVGRIDDSETNMGGAETLIRRPGAMHHAISHGMDRHADRTGQVDAVVEVPAIRVDTWTVGRVHLIRRGGAVAERPDEATGALSAKRSFLASVSCFTNPSVSCFTNHCPFPFCGSVAAMAGGA